MIFKVIYQENPHQVPLRENSQSLYVEAESLVEAREKVDQHTPYNVEYIQPLSQAHLAYEQEHNPDFKITEF